MIKTLDPVKKLQPSDFERVEFLFGFDFPDDYKSFMLEFKGGRPIPPAFDYVGVDGVENSTAIRTFYSIDNFEKIEDDIETNILYYWENERLIRSVIPIAVDIAGNLVCMSISEVDYGKISLWDHEFELDLECHENLAKLADSFTEFLAILYDCMDDL